ncbi:Rv1733c family protein [Pseudonocardia xishanensis]|uniref:Membrane protein n=1 Tax=Pseudonocardia xishanensis TaxID=630995 RepID=A0ABP8RMR4_9PSEU
MANHTHRDGSGEAAPRAARVRRRRTDRVEDAAAALLVLTTIVAALVIAVFSVSVYRGGADRAEREAADRTRVVAVATADAPVGTSSVRGGTSLPVTVPAAWTTSDGRAHAGDVRVTGRPKAGEEIPLWVDRNGAAVPAPETWGTAVGVALANAAVLLVALGFAVWWASRAVRAVMVRANAGAWEREWAAVEPRWSGRASKG